MARGRKSTTTTRPAPAAPAAPPAEPVEVPVPPDDLLRLKRGDGSTFATLGLHVDTRGNEWLAVLGHGLEGALGLGVSLRRREVATLQLLFDGRVRVVADIKR